MLWIERTTETENGINTINDTVRMSRHLVIGVCSIAG